MDEETMPCGYYKCDVHMVRPGKSQCSYVESPLCGILKMSSKQNRYNRLKSLFQSTKEDLNHLKDQLEEADFCIDYLQGKVLDRDAKIERLEGLVLHLLYCPKQACSFCTQIEKEFRNER
jgi:hypothetical protein